MTGGYEPDRRVRAAKSAKEHYEERRQRRNRQLDESAVFPLTVAMIVDRDNLFDCYREVRKEGGQSPGTDQLRYADLSPVEVGPICATLSDAIQRNCYQPQPPRPVEIPKPGTTKKRHLAIPTILDRVVAKAVHRAFEPYWEKVFLDCSWGFRPQRNTWGMLRAIERAMQESGRTVLAIDDLKTAFEMLPLQEVRAAHQQLLDGIPVPPLTGRPVITRRNAKNNLLRLIMMVLSGGDTDRARGIGQGNNYSPTAMNGVLHFLLDVPLMAKIPSPLWFRYADNICYLAESVSEGAEVLADTRQLLTPTGLSLKGEDGVFDLQTSEAQLLGFRLQYQDEKLICGLPDRAYDQLGENFRAAYDSVHPHQTACQVLQGWINSYGPAFENGATDPPGILRIAADSGFRELASPRSVQVQMQKAAARWRRFRKRDQDHGGDGE